MDEIDETTSAANLIKLPAQTLKDKCTELNLPSTGNKGHCVRRIIAHFNPVAAADAGKDTVVDLGRRLGLKKDTMMELKNNVFTSIEQLRPMTDDDLSATDSNMKDRLQLRQLGQ